MRRSGLGNALRYCRILPVVVSVFLLQAGCQQQAQTEHQAQFAQAETALDVNQPRITFEKNVYDYGEIAPKIDKTYEIPFTNTGRAVLKINNVEACCGATATIDKQEYAPGESGTVKVKLQTAQFPSVIEKRLYLHSNDPVNPTMPLIIKAEVKQKITVEPPVLRLSLEKENADCPEMKIKNLDGKTFAIGGFKSTGDCITAEADPSVKATEFVLHPKVDMEKLKLNQDGIIEIKITDSEWGGVGVMYNVIPTFTIRPSMIIVFDAKPNIPMRRSISILNNYEENFEVESFSSKNNFVKVVDTKKSENAIHYLLEITPPDVSGQQGFNDEFIINIKGGKQISVTCRGFYQ